MLSQGFEWSGLEKGTLIVDVGGGIGNQSMTLAENHSQLRFIIQDRELVLKDAAAVSQSNYMYCEPRLRAFF